MQKGKTVFWIGLPNSCEMKRSERQRRKGKRYPLECRVPKNSKKRFLRKKAFLSDQCKEIEENNRMGKTTDHFKKIRDTKGTFHAKMGSIKDRNGMDLTEAEDIKERWQEYIEELYQEDHHDPNNHSGVITNLEPDILECEAKWSFGSINTNKASGGDGIPVELFQILNWFKTELVQNWTELNWIRNSAIWMWRIANIFRWLSRSYSSRYTL